MHNPLPGLHSWLCEPHNVSWVLCHGLVAQHPVQKTGFKVKLMGAKSLATVRGRSRMRMLQDVCQRQWLELE